MFHLINLDALTHAADLSYLKAVADAPNYTFVKGDIYKGTLVKQLFEEYQISDEPYLAAESHVDTSILQPLQFAQTNVMRSLQLLYATRSHPKQLPKPLQIILIAPITIPINFQLFYPTTPIITVSPSVS